MWANVDRARAAGCTGDGLLTRRRALRSLAVAATSVTARTQAAPQAPRGLVLPRLPAPDLPLTDCQGQPIGLATLLHGQVTAVQLMFAGCSSVCPLQGAVFAAVAHQVNAPGVRLPSLTIDPMGVSPTALRGWLGRFGHACCGLSASPTGIRGDLAPRGLTGVE